MSRLPTDHHWSWWLHHSWYCRSHNGRSYIYSYSHAANYLYRATTSTYYICGYFHGYSHQHRDEHCNGYTYTVYT